MRRANFAIAISLIVGLVSALALSQSGGTFLIEKSVIAGGGGFASGGTFALDGTIGQSLAGTNSSGGVFSLDSGFWASSAAPTTISGTISYGNAIGAPIPRFVSNVTITGSGSPSIATTTGPPGPTEGQYFLSGFGSGAYTVTPTKTTGVNGISSFDAGRIALYVAGPPNPTLNPTQLLVADVSGNGIVTSFDAAMIAKYVAGPPFIAPGIGSTATWRFTPANRSYASVTSNVTSADYTALLMGEVSGNWNNSGARMFEGGSGNTGSASADSAPDINVSVKAPAMSAKEGDEFIVPIAVEGKGSKQIISYEFDLRYDPTVLRLQKDPIDVDGTVSRNLTAVVNADEPGLLKVVMYGASSIDENGILLKLKFRAVGAKGSASPLVWEKIMFNEYPRSVAIDGKVELF